MFRTGVLLQFIAFLTITCGTLEPSFGKEAGVRKSSDERQLAQQQSISTSHATTEACTAFDSNVLGNNPKLCSAPISGLQTKETRGGDRTNERPNQMPSKDDELLRKVFELRNTIRVLSAAHNDLLFSMTQNEPRWVRVWLQMSWNYPLRYGRNDDHRLFDVLKKSGSFNFTSKAEFLSESDRNNLLLSEGVRQYLLDLPRRTGRGSVLDSSLFPEEEWNKWKTRLTQIRHEINLLQLKNVPYEYKDAVVEKLDGFLEDFYDQLFRTHITWMYSKERSWLEHVMETSAAKISNVKSSGTEKLQYMSNMVTGTFVNGKRALLQALAEKAMELEELGRRSQKNIHLRAGILQPFHVVGNLSLENIDFGGFIDSFSGKPIAHATSLAFALGGILILIAIYLFEERILALISGTRRSRRIQNSRRRNRVRGAPNNTGNNNTSVTVSSSILPLQGQTPVQQQRYPTQPRLPNPSASHPEVVVLDDENEPHQPGGDRPGSSPETATSFKGPSNGVNRRGRHNFVSISELGPVRRPTVAESLRVGNRRVNIAYEGQANDDNHDEDDEVIAIVQSAQGSHQKRPRNIITKKKTSRSESRKGILESQKALDGVPQRTTRLSRDTKGSLTGASNLSFLTDQTRVLRSKANTRTTDALANHRGVGKSSLPRRHSARLSTSHSKENRE
ncbi:hypothetical protein BWQ96_02649 [Gracilariopsis chorda]|uniref:Transmembrane protein n=1 Tax=Gracilariopsis chorda TaxID=448386 RepID=A0A2V3IZK4_9FLOR|nr:hypothetical protein BWQ96_02649 [Gracilariopsis chorda]|eukprot:PXF47505.1 hypothetical protein BWQ96_02649 [Gracilariopsis chorda]